MSYRRTVLVVIVAVLVMGCGDTTGKGTRVAAILNLTGSAAQFDAIKQNTLTIADSLIARDQRTIDLELRVFDAGGSAEITAAAVDRASSWEAEAYLSGTSPTALAIAARQRGSSDYVHLANAANPDFGPPRHKGEYRLWPHWGDEAQLIFRLIRREQYSRVLLIHSADPYSEALTESLKEYANDLPALSWRELSFDPSGSPDFRPALLRAKADGFEAIVIFGLPPGIRSLMNQMAATQWEGAMIGGVNINLVVQDFDAAGLKGPLWLIQTEAMEDSLSAGSVSQEFREAYTDRFGDPPPFHALYLADGLYLIAEAQRLMETEEESLRDGLSRVETFQAPSGTVTLKENGVLEYRMRLRRVRP